MYAENIKNIYIKEWYCESNVITDVNEIPQYNKNDNNS